MPDSFFLVRLDFACAGMLSCENLLLDIEIQQVIIAEQAIVRQGCKFFSTINYHLSSLCVTTPTFSVIRRHQRL